MLELKTRKELSQEAFKLAESFDLVRYRSITYMPADYETRDTTLTPSPDRTIWIPLNREGIRKQAASNFDTLFGSESELSSFDFMVAQNSTPVESVCNSLLVRTDEGLKELRDDGEMYPPTGTFVPNTLVPMLNTDADAKARVFAVISGWLDSDEEAHALLRHFATALAPGWSAVKYVLLLGEGRNGKSLLLKMLQAVFGWDNVSNVTRQQIAEQSPVVTELNGKLLNIVFDGRAEYVKDSGLEKSLIAGEVIPIRRLYESVPTPVQTNALFVEGLNREPKSTDKSLALQKRLMRFQFPNVYALDHRFEKRMLAEESLGAFLALLIDHYVHIDDVAEKLAPTKRAMELQLEHMFVNSVGLQFLKHLEEHDTFGASGIVGTELTELVQRFQAWRIKENDLGQWAEPDVLALFSPVINTDRRSKRVNGTVRKVRYVSSLKVEAIAFIETLKGDDEDELAAMVED
jgi:hypothetical protein